MVITSNNIKQLSFKFEGMWIAFVICVAIVVGTSYSIFSYAAFALSVIAVAALSEEDSLCLLMFIMPFANIFKRAVGTQSFFTYLILFYVLLHYIKNHYIHKAFLLSLLCLLAFLALQMLFSINALRLIKFVANLLFVYSAINLKTNNEEKKIYIYYIYGILISSLVAALNVIPNLVDYIGSTDIRYEHDLVSRFAGLYGDPNHYSINVIISLCLIIILNHKKQISNLISICFAVLLVVFAGMTLSKSAFLMLMLPLMLLLHTKIKKKNYLLFLCIVIAFVFFVIVLFSGKITLFNGILYRLSNAEDLSSLTTGRYRIWQNYNAFFSGNLFQLFFGCGFGAELVNGYASHNTYIDLIYYLGVVGTVLLLVVFLAMIGIKKSTTKPTWLNYSIWLCLATMYFFLAMLFYFDWSFHIIIAILISRTDMNSITPCE